MVDIATGTEEVLVPVVLVLCVGGRRGLPSLAVSSCGNLVGWERNATGRPNLSGAVQLFLILQNSQRRAKTSPFVHDDHLPSGGFRTRETGGC